LELMRALQVPVDKTVRMLLIEDVIRSVCKLAGRPGENETGT